MAVCACAAAAIEPEPPPVGDITFAQVYIMGCTWVVIGLELFQMPGS